ncbi:hypothetical protein IW261DRAFT_1565997 [Armillaria novae-zelandiae]|uniref:Inhibitor of growth protein N-terminal histone-binding domain-containing protein n=1 Tax=Armillaria novae-zelandiae TaxID=153914 RepID=A0AA39UG99_9AGAR|nr:hypothetical protein IW261DRAFT_1565997 [Armillaria novae-zelandiae]
MTPSVLVVKVVIISLCKDPATAVNDNLDQFQEYAGYLECYKWELIQDKELKDSVFRARTAIEKEHHTNASKQPLHRVLKAITGWIQSECSQATDGPPAGAPTGPRRDPKSAGPTTHSKGKGCATRRLCATIDSDSDSDDDGLDQVAPQSDSDVESIKMAVDERSGETSRSSKSSKARSHDASVGDKHKESSKDDPSCCIFCSGNTHPPSECPERAHSSSRGHGSRDGPCNSKCTKSSFPLPSTREYYPHRSRGSGDRRPASALGLVSTALGDGGALPSVDVLRESYTGPTLGSFTVERPEHLAKLESALMGDVLVLQHTLVVAERQHAFLLDEIERIQLALHPGVAEVPDAGDPAPVEAEAAPVPSTSADLDPPSA